MPFSSVFNAKDQCKEGKCKVNKQNIKKIFKPDDGFLDSQLEKRLFSSSYKICDCIIVCNNNKIVIVEILCGKLTYREYKEKYEQLENCHKVVKNKGLEDKIKKIVLHYQKLEDSRRNPLFRKKLLNPKIYGMKLEMLTDLTINIHC